MASLSPYALALIAVSEDNRRLRADVAARDALLDARAAGAAVTAYEHGKAIAAVELELRTAERQVLTLTEQLAVAEDDARVDREALARYRARDANRGGIQ